MLCCNYAIARAVVDDSIPPSVDITCETVNRTGVLIRWSISNVTNVVEVSIENFAIITYDGVHFVPVQVSHCV